MSKERSTPQEPSAIERALAYATIAIIAAALLSFFATLIVGMIDGAALAAGFWPFVYGFSLIGLPIGFVLLITLLILSQARRRADFKRNAHKN
ncbi:hypothetical protein [Leucobacter sp. gxy201]|uniref:hypothetical protein n=1 Tax=Leucobacter sp. gxy201 TaxID=2957200 RepID=UPI003D9FDB19